MRLLLKSTRNLKVAGSTPASGFSYSSILRLASFFCTFWQISFFLPAILFGLGSSLSLPSIRRGAFLFFFLPCLKPGHMPPYTQRDMLLLTIARDGNTNGVVTSCHLFSFFGSSHLVSFINCVESGQRTRDMLLLSRIIMSLTLTYFADPCPVAVTDVSASFSFSGLYSSPAACSSLP